VSQAVRPDGFTPPAAHASRSDFRPNLAGTSARLIASTGFAGNRRRGVDRGSSDRIVRGLTTPVTVTCDLMISLVLEAAVRYFLREDAMDRSKIEWTESTWNPTIGCTEVSPGCDHCYAKRITQRFPATYPNGFDLTLRAHALELPLRWKAPRRIFVNSMSDLFHADVPERFIARVFEVMARAPQHEFQILTKRAERLARLAPRLPWPSNVWMGVSVELQAYFWRIDYLRKIPAAVRFVSAEPLLGSLAGINLEGVHWLIAGGESQPGCRPAELDWFRELRDACRGHGAAFFLKQLGGHPSKRGGKEALLDTRLWHELPTRTASAPPASPPLSPKTSSRVVSVRRRVGGTTVHPSSF
jgi:protein gp37